MYLMTGKSFRRVLHILEKLSKVDPGVFLLYISMARDFQFARTL